jgi:uncharacterized membrane protein YfcA
MWFDAVIVVAALAGGAVAGVVGFGIGSLLTPAFALQMDARLAVAAVSIPHFAGTVFRFWLLGGRADWAALRSFGVTSALGGLTGALLQEFLAVPWLFVLFGTLLLFTAAAELSGIARRMRFRGPWAWIAGALSGVLGGLVGNQGGIRSGALLGLDLSKSTFVATATAVGLIVDVSRVPVYVAYEGEALAALARPVVLAILGVVAGTVFGHRMLVRLPERWFRRTVTVVIALLGAWMVAQGIGEG